MMNITTTWQPHTHTPSNTWPQILTTSLHTFTLCWNYSNNNQQPPFYGQCHYTGQHVLAGTSSQELKDFVCAKFYCPHAPDDSSQHIQIREKTLEFSSAVLSTLSPYHKTTATHIIILSKTWLAKFYSYRTSPLRTTNKIVRSQAKDSNYDWLAFPSVLWHRRLCIRKSRRTSGL